MKILHTADWHMNESLGRVDRSADIVGALEQIAKYLDEYQVDVLLVAGDVFSDRSREEQLRAAVAEIKRIFTPFLTRGGTIVAITGNHDKEVFFQMLRDALDLVSPGRVGINNTQATGRLYVAPNARQLCLADSHGNKVQFVLMPYPTSRNYLRGDRINFPTVEEKHRFIHAKFSETLEELKHRLDSHVPSVLVSHIHVRGVPTHSLYRLTEAEDVIFEQNEIPWSWAYVAYGHIHRPQAVFAHAPQVRYAGSIERLDANEKDDQKSVVLFEIVGAGLVGASTTLPLDATPIYQIEIRDPDTELAQLAARYPDANRALVKYTLHYDPMRHNRDAITRELDALLPRWYDREFVESGTAQTSAAQFNPERVHDVIGTVREYLDKQLDKHPHKQELLTLAEQLLAEEEGV